MLPAHALADDGAIAERLLDHVVRAVVVRRHEHLDRCQIEKHPRGIPPIDRVETGRCLNDREDAPAIAGDDGRRVQYLLHVSQLVEFVDQEQHREEILT